jgi:hypothetical protein
MDLFLDAKLEVCASKLRPICVQRPRNLGRRGSGPRISRMARIDLAALKTAIHPQKNAEGHRSSFRGAMRRVRDRSVLFCEFLWMYFGMVCAHRLPTRRPGDDSFYPCRVCRAGGLEPVARSKLEDRIVSRKGAKAQRGRAVWRFRTRRLPLTVLRSQGGIDAFSPAVVAQRLPWVQEYQPAAPALKGLQRILTLRSR